MPAFCNALFWLWYYLNFTVKNHENRAGRYMQPAVVWKRAIGPSEWDRRDGSLGAEPPVASVRGRGCLRRKFFECHIRFGVLWPTTDPPRVDFLPVGISTPFNRMCRLSHEYSLKLEWHFDPFSRFLHNTRALRTDRQQSRQTTPRDHLSQITIL